MKKFKLLELEKTKIFELWKNRKQLMFTSECNIIAKWNFLCFSYIKILFVCKIFLAIQIFEIILIIPIEKNMKNFCFTLFSLYKSFNLKKKETSIYFEINSFISFYI